MNKRIFIFLFALWAMVSCTEKATPVDSIKFDEDTFSLTVGESVTVGYSVYPSDADVDKAQIKWNSSDETIVTVDQYGIFRAESQGEAIVTMTYSGLRASCKVVVYPNIVLQFDKTSLVMSSGEKYQLELSVVPEQTSYNAVWTSDNESVVTVNNTGEVTAVSEGEAVITAKVYAKTVTCKVQVLSGPKIGDYYYEDNTYSTELDKNKKVIGIVIALNVDGYKGKILSLDEFEGPWGPMKDLDAINEFDGKENQKVVELEENWQTDYQGFAWAKAKNDGGLEWYIPANREWRQIMAGTRGLLWIAGSEGDPLSGTVSDWDGDFPMPYFQYFEEQFNDFNHRLEAAGGENLMDEKEKMPNSYWTSVNIVNYAFPVAQRIALSSGSISFNQKSSAHMFRAIAGF